MGKAALITFRSKRIPCLMLAELLGLERAATGCELTLVLLRLASGDRFALAVDGIHSHGDLVVKPLAPGVMRSGFYAGSTLLDDGEPVLLRDITGMAARHNLLAEERGRVVQESATVAAPAQAFPQAMLFTDCSVAAWQSGSSWCSASRPLRQARLIAPRRGRGR